MEITLKHSLSYTTKRDVPVSVVAKSLLANERLIHESVRLLEECFDDLQVEKVNVKVQSLTNGSPLKELLSIGVFFTFQEGLEETVPEIIQMLTGATIPENTETLVTVLVILIAIYVIDHAVERIFPGKDIKALKQEYNSKMELLSEIISMEPSDIEEVFNKRLNEGKSKSLFKKALEFFLPAKLEPGTTIETENPRVNISNDAIQEVPSDVDFAQEEKQNVYQMNGVSIEIHRADTDYSNQGWIAIIEQVDSNRKKMILPPEVDPSILFTKRKITGDVNVVEEKQLDGDYAVKEYHLIRML